MRTIMTIIKGWPYSLNVREQQNRYLSFYHKLRNVMSVPCYRNSMKLMLVNFVTRRALHELLNHPPTDEQTSVSHNKLGTVVTKLLISLRNKVEETMQYKN